MTILLSHTRADGTTVTGTSRGDAAGPVLKQQGFRWSSAVGWYLRGTRDRAVRQDVIDATATALRAAGYDVEVTVDDTPRRTETVETDRAERAAARATRLDTRADRLRGSADDQWQQTDAIAGRIPLGQPILLGHHSQRRHERDLERINRGRDKAITAARDADAASRAADASRAHQQHHDSGPVIERRLDRLRATLRDLQRRLDGTSNAVGGPATGAYRDRLTAAAADVTEQIGYWENQLAALVDSGAHHVWTSGEFTKGDRVRFRWGWATVEHVNRRTLTVRSDVMPQVTNAVAYDKVVEKASPPHDSGAAVD